MPTEALPPDEAFPLLDEDEAADCTVFGDCGMEAVRKHPESGIGVCETHFAIVEARYQLWKIAPTGGFV